MFTFSRTVFTFAIHSVAVYGRLVSGLGGSDEGNYRGYEHRRPFGQGSYTI